MTSFDSLYESLLEGDPTGQMIALTELNEILSLSNGKYQLAGVDLIIYRESAHGKISMILLCALSPLLDAGSTGSVYDHLVSSFLNTKYIKID